MEHFYYLVTIVLYGVFIIRFILSWIGADFDIDADADLDLGDLVSFKGVTHFLMGAFSWLSLALYTRHNIFWYDYFVAFLIGLIFTGILFYVYKFMMNLESKPEVLSGVNLVGKTGTVYLVQGNYYIVTVSNGIGTTEVSGKSKKSLKVGDNVVLSDYWGGYYTLV